MGRIEYTIPIAKVDDADNIVYGVVYAATDPAEGKAVSKADRDTDGNWARAEQVKKACHNFNRKLLTGKLDKMGVDKNHNGVAGYGIVLESYIAKSEIPDIAAKPGDWVAAVQVTDKDTMAEIRKGDITGFSIGGTAVIIEDGKEVESK